MTIDYLHMLCFPPLLSPHTLLHSAHLFYLHILFFPPLLSPYTLLPTSSISTYSASHLFYLYILFFPPLLSPHTLLPTSSISIYSASHLSSVAACHRNWYMMNHNYGCEKDSGWLVVTDCGTKSSTCCSWDERTACPGILFSNNPGGDTAASKWILFLYQQEMI